MTNTSHLMILPSRAVERRKDRKGGKRWRSESYDSGRSAFLIDNIIGFHWAIYLHLHFLTDPCLWYIFFFSMFLAFLGQARS
jgi:hypothetical protein